MKSSDLAGGAKGEEEYDRTENEQDRGHVHRPGTNCCGLRTGWS